MSRWLVNNDDEHWGADWDSDVSMDDIPAVHPNDPVYLFDNPSSFANRHGNGTRAEFNFERVAINSFNKKLRVFYAWPIIILGHDGINDNWLFFVQTGADDSMLPKEGENCIMKLPWADIRYEKESKDGKKFHTETRFISKQACRVENPCSRWRIKDDYWERTMAFEVAIPSNRLLPFKAIINPEDAEKGFSRIPRPKSSELHVAFELRLSCSTSGAELNALDKFKEALGTSPSKLSPEMAYRRPAFRFLLQFHPQSYLSLFRVFPHLADPFQRPGKVPKELMKMLGAMNPQQKAAYKDGLSKIPDRVCFVAGGPGAGATDVANKLVETFKKLGLKRNVIRMYCWSDEMNSATENLLETQKQELYYRMTRKGQGEEQQNKDGPLSKYDSEKDESNKTRVRRFTPPFFTSGCRSKSHYKDEKDSRRAPTLEEAVAAFYEEHKDTTYAELQDLSTVNSRGLEDLRNQLVERVYKDFLKVVDVVVTTPVTASKFAPSLRVFDPKLVIFDEAPHAWELSIMIPIANFSPEAWIFTGDHRQTKPYVGSYGSHRNVNKHALQLRTSTMERAFKANPNMPSLLINHRARGNLHEPASSMFYGGKMIPAIEAGSSGAIPPSTEHLRKTYIMPMKGENGRQVSRLLTVLQCAHFDREESRVQGSLFNQSHQDWVERLGSIEYRKMINDLRRTPSGLNGCVVEARTTDTAQGHEADAVILDFVSDWITKHLEDPNRLCVALSRARQAEFILMHKDMEDKLEDHDKYAQGPLGYMLRHCKRSGEFVRRVKKQVFTV
ncbi:hypothetical protein INS49_014270 [Diaporthe citri]|uniref:uncharacterized protein n=1 Tax=Diaporthe citri TaxID=83186 RepID=UPI001C7F8D6B|nr:uncharacterized protein INS49_014270 [Diaporthe citri]KAG6358386.1 hypothetical protein INS49_014270 [Diaporthe citri]